MEHQSAGKGTECRVECIGLTKRFGPLTVLDNLDLQINVGEKVAIIGPSGSGKTTLLRLLMGLEEPTSGTILIDGRPLWSDKDKSLGQRERSELRRRIGYVFQQFNLFPHMSAKENVTMAPRKVKKLPKQETERMAMELLDRVGLGAKADSYPSQLSGGQQQRVAIARALAMDPEIMLFDEATSALDPELVGEVLKVIADLALHTSMTMALVTHEMNFARKVADRILFFDGGRIVEQGSPEDIFTRPQHPRTQAFLNQVEAV